MMASDLAQVCEFIESRWGSLPKAWNHSRAMHDEFRRFTTGAVMESLQELFREGEVYAPKPPTVYKRAGIVQARRFEDGTDPRPTLECQGDHRWGVVHYAGATVVHNGERVPACLWSCDELTEHQACALCGEERYMKRAAA